MQTASTQITALFNAKAPVGAGPVLQAIQAASSRTGVDFAYLLHKAGQESGFNPQAKASSSSATGLFQFINQTWLQVIKQNGEKYGLAEEAKAITMNNGKAEVKDPVLREKILNLRHDPVLSSAMAAEFTRDNKDYLDAAVGGTIGSTELYMAHFLGAGGAAKFIKGLRNGADQTGAELFPEAAAANKSVFYDKSGKALSLKNIYERFAAKFNDGASATSFAMNGGNSAVPAAAPAFTLKRDLAALSPDFYRPPPEVADILRQGGTTSDTLFNVMVMAQKSLNEALRLDTLGAAKKAYN